MGKKVFTVWYFVFPVDSDYLLADYLCEEVRVTDPLFVLHMNPQQQLTIFLYHHVRK